MAKLGQLKSQLNSFKASLARYATFVDSFDAHGDDFEQLQMRTEAVVNLLDEYIKVQTKIDNVEPSDEDNITDFENGYYRTLQKAKRLIKSATPNIGTPTPAPAINIEGELPKLKLPSFSGDHDGWLPFYNSFKSLVHDRDSLSTMQKFHYLVSCLKGDAADIVASSEIRPESYDAAWATLNDAYYNKYKLVQTHINAIFNLPSVAKECPEALQQLTRAVAKHIRALKLLGRPTEKSDDLIVYIIRSKLDTVTRREWDRTMTRNHFPRIEEICDFIQVKCDSMEPVTKVNKSNDQRRAANNSAGTDSTCGLCKGSHFIARCNDFKRLAVEERFNTAKAAGLCINCLKRANHPLSSCFAPPCTTCQKRHNILLRQVAERPPSTNASVALTMPQTTQALLCTAIIYAKHGSAKPIEGRALLDCGAQLNFVTAKFAKRLGARSVETEITLDGINSAQSRATSKTTINIKSRVNAFATDLDCYVINQISGCMPQTSFDKNVFKIPKKLRLADPRFHESGPVDLLIGAQIFWDLLCVGRIQLGKGLPCVQRTHLGWLVGGGGWHPSSTTATCNLIAKRRDVNFNLERFWKIEEVPLVQNDDDVEGCERHFVETHGRADDGRFIVKLPFKLPELALGRSRHLALKRFYALERKFAKAPRLRTDYVNVINEFVSLGHMALVKRPSDEGQHFYLPHHCELKADSITTKLRVVFDASAKSDNGRALNDIVHKGPVVQEDLVSILLRFRTFKFILAADIVKMYRQVLLHLSSCTFIAALRRFTARRGMVRNIYSDNGTNFAGANRQLREVTQYFNAIEHQRIVTREFANEGISWHFSPPRSPHWGGLWEAAVKMAKYHLHRVAGGTKLTFEELQTLMAQIEAILNSRPLTPISNDPNDVTFLTPGHFLIGDALTALPTKDVTTTKVNRLSRWQHLQYMQQHFWKRWSHEYLGQLQGRHKWKGAKEAPQMGQMVILRDENLPPTRWRSARIEALHPGKDGVVRAITVRCELRPG